jgi:hypothetical protein
MLPSADACCRMHVVKVMRAAVELRKLTFSFSLSSHWPTCRSLEQVLVNHIHSFDLPSRASCVVFPLPLGTLLSSGRWRSVPKLQREKLQSRNMQLLVCLISLDHRPEQLRPELVALSIRYAHHHAAQRTTDEISGGPPPSRSILRMFGGPPPRKSLHRKGTPKIWSSTM